LSLVTPKQNKQTTCNYCKNTSSFSDERLKKEVFFLGRIEQDENSGRADGSEDRVYSPSFGVSPSTKQGDGIWCEDCLKRGHYSWLDFSGKDCCGRDCFMVCEVCREKQNDRNSQAPRLDRKV
jgi:hypothetical protein